MKAAVLSLYLCAVATVSHASTVGWGASGTQGLALASGTLAPAGDLVRLGFFSLTDAQIQAYASAGDRTSLNNAFQEYGSSVVGFGFNTPGYWSKSSSNSSLSFPGNQIYYWTFDASTLTAATQWGIYKSPTWSFPAQNPNPGSTTTDLNQVPTNSTGLIVGSYSAVSPAQNGTTGVYKMTAISAVPEPSTIALGTIIAVATLSLRFRRRQAH